MVSPIVSRSRAPWRRIVPYVYLKPYTRRALLVTPLISIIQKYRDVASRVGLFQMRHRRVYDGERVKLLANIVYKASSAYFEIFTLKSRCDLHRRTNGYDEYCAYKWRFDFANIRSLFSVPYGTTLIRDRVKRFKF